MSRVVVVTGGTRGIGRAVVERFEAAGDRVVALGSADCDVTDEGSVAETFERIGAVDVLVNNAGVSSSAPLARTTLDDWRAQMTSTTRRVLRTRTALRAGSSRDPAASSRSPRGRPHGARATRAYSASSTRRSADARPGAARGGHGVTAKQLPGVVRTEGRGARSADRLRDRPRRGAGEAALARSRRGRLLGP